jgi:hypothetical protein
VVEANMSKPKYTLRRSGQKMTTFAIKFHVTEAAVKWAAEKLGVNEATALRAIRAAYSAGLSDFGRVLTLVTAVLGHDLGQPTTDETEAGTRVL